MTQPRWLEALVWLDDLRRAGKVRHLGGTNFDTPHLREILAAGLPVVSMQVQYSLLDRRPENGFAALCQAHGVALLCYGTVAGGFLSDRWLGAPEPTAAVRQPFARQIQAHHRRFRRLGSVPAAVACPAPRRRPARRRHRQRRDAADARLSWRRRGDRRRHLARASRSQRRRRRVWLSTKRIVRRSKASPACAAALLAMSMRSSAIAPAATARS